MFIFADDENYLQPLVRNPDGGLSSVRHGDGPNHSATIRGISRQIAKLFFFFGSVVLFALLHVIL